MNRLTLPSMLPAEKKHKQRADSPSTVFPAGSWTGYQGSRGKHLKAAVLYGVCILATAGCSSDLVTNPLNQSDKRLERQIAEKVKNDPFPMASGSAMAPTAKAKK